MLVFSTVQPGTNPITPDTGTFDTDTWSGDSDVVVFTFGGTSDHRRISSIKVTYEGEEPSPEETVNLGYKTIAQVKNYIASHTIPTNTHGNGVDEHRYVTIKGYAMAKIDLIKTVSNYGLNVSYPGKVIMADSTGIIAAASQVSSQGTCLWGKVGDYVCQSTSKYTVTGYISTYLGHPEIMVTSFEWDKNMEISLDLPSISEVTDLAGFYEKAVNNQYNCAGHGYGEVVTVNNLKCFYVESDGSGKRYYNFTDGTKNIRVNAFNLSTTVTVGSICNVTGIISLKNLSPIIVAFNIAKVTDPEDFTFDYVAASVGNEITIQQLKVIHGSQADTSARYDNVVNAYGRIFKTTGYLTAVKENEKLYVGISDNYINRTNIIQGKDNAMANYGVSLIKNDNFWNTTEEELYLFNPTYDQYLFENTPITVYYIVRQQRFNVNKPMWEIFLIPEFVDSLNAAV